MISMMMSALSLPAAGTATTISLVLNVTNKEVESGLNTRETRRLEILQLCSETLKMFGVWGEKASMRNGPKQFFAEIKTTPLVSFF